MNSKHHISSIFKWLFLLAIIGVGVWVYFNHVWLYDYFRASNYQPSTEMAKIRDSLKLTEEGEFLFNASHPELDSEEEFNQNCQSFSSESAVLGCYTNQNIYVYNITEPSLNGIRELTSAHELLHAVYARMSSAEKDALRSDLDKVYQTNQALLEPEIESYDKAAQLEEIYVRSGTEVKNLPASLETHFAKIFQDQDYIVDFYNSYAEVFKSLEREFEILESEMNTLKAQIDTKTSEYETRAAALDAKIDDFNRCANQINCFTSEEDFYTARNQLLSEQNSLDSLYYELDNLINLYNSKVEAYNNNVIKSENLQNIINSHVRVEGV